MSNLWNTPDIPHKGWQCVNVEDVRSNGESPEETNYRVCEMCGQERIRFIHTMRHDSYPKEMNVGCMCAEKMSGDYVLPRQRESELRCRSTRREKWLERRWKISAKGHPWLKAGDYHIVVAAEAGTPPRFRLYINQKRGKYIYESDEIAKLAAFDAIEIMKQRGRNQAPRNT